MTNSPNHNLTAQGNRSVVVGRDVIHSIINTGDHTKFFIGDYERLCDAYIEPWSVFERVDLAHFVGRGRLLAEIDVFLDDHDRGYFILEANAGLGKTTFLAWLTRERGYIHHFTELAPGLDGVGRGLKNLGAQLVLAYRLNPYETEGVLPAAAARPDYLLKLLKQAADQRQFGEKIVLVVDALNEASTPASQNVLGLPQVLPEGVFIIVAQRPVSVTLRVDTATTPRQVFYLAADSAENRADMRLFLEQAAITWPGIIQALQQSDYTSEQFTNTLLEKCQGVWIYLRYAVGEIARGERSPLDLETLPNGLWQYYAQNWGRWRERDATAWYDQILPLLSMLAVAQEPMTAGELAAGAGVDISFQLLHQWLEEHWSPFLSISGHGRYARYQFYHATLREFFAGQVKLEGLRAEQSLVYELAERTRQAHSHVAEHCLAAWGGLQAGLPQLLRETKRQRKNGGYCLRYLTTHLAAAGRWDLLTNLLNQTAHTDEQAVNVWAEAKRQATGSYASYLADMTMAWEHATQNNDVGSQVRYALVYSSIVSLLQDSKESTTLEAVTPESKFVEATLILDPRQRLETLASLMPSLNPNDQAQAKTMAVEIASDVTRQSNLREYSVTRFAPFFDAAELASLYPVACSLAKWYRVPALGALVAYMAHSSLRQEIIQKLFDEFKDTSDVLGGGISVIWPSLCPWPMHPDVQYEWPNVVTKALPWIRLLPIGEQRIIFDNLLSNLEAINADLDRSIKAWEENGKIPAIVDIAAKWSSHMPEDLASIIQASALESLVTCRDDDSIANSLLTLGPCLVPDLFPTVKQVARKIKSKWMQAEVLLYFEPQLGSQEVLRLERVLNNPRFLVIEAIRQVRNRAYHRFELIYGVPIWILFALKIWLVAQFKGGLKWDTTPRFRHEPGDVSAIFPDGLAAPSLLRSSTLIDDGFEGSLTLFSLIAPRLKDEQWLDIRQRFWKKLELLEKLNFGLTWICQKAFISSQIREYHPYRHRPSFLWGTVGMVGSLIPHTTNRTFGEESSDLVIAERLRTLNIPAFPHIIPGFTDIGGAFIKLAAIVPSLPSAGQKRILPEPIDILRDLESSDEDRAEMLILLSRMPVAHCEGILSQMISVAALIEDRYFHLLTLSALVPHLLKLPAHEASAILDRCLHALARRGRPKLIIDLRFLAPLVEKLGGPDAVREVAGAIIDVGNWWS